MGTSSHTFELENHEWHQRRKPRKRWEKTRQKRRRRKRLKQQREERLSNEKRIERLFKTSTAS